MITSALPVRFAFSRLLGCRSSSDLALVLSRSIQRFGHAHCAITIHVMPKPYTSAQMGFVLPGIHLSAQAVTLRKLVFGAC